MNKQTPFLILSTLAMILAFTVSTAWGHHGWAWAEDEQIEMTGEILEIFVGPPHPRLQIKTEDDGEWRIDLGNPTQTQRAGFDESSAEEGDTVLVRGHRSRDANEKWMKAVRITIDDEVYTFYPSRVQED